MGQQAAAVDRSRQALGQFGENLAAGYLHGLGYQIVERNWRHEIGELDLVALDGECLVFVEVKTRSTLACGYPAEAIGAVKLARLRRLAGAYLQQKQPTAEAIRLDVIAVTTGGGPRQVEHILGVDQ